MKNVTRESKIEKSCKLLAKSRGWFQVKIERASIRGFPDRIFIKNGNTVYIEFKSETGRLSDEQVRVIADMREHGASVWVVSSIGEANEIFK